LISACLRISLVSVLILTGIKPITAQQKDLNVFLQYFDAETEIPEEDITLLNEMLKGRWSAGKMLADQILKLSVIEYEDEVLLSKVRGIKTFYNIASNEGASPFLRELVQAIAVNEVRLAESGDLMINQYMVFGEDNRYRWKINYNRNNYSLGIIAERDPNENKLLDHLSGYLKWHGIKDEIILGDYQIVSGFGLWSWRSVSTRKSFESITGLPRMGKGILPYRSSNEYWYIRGINYNRDTRLGNFSLSIGNTKQDGKFDEKGDVNISTSGLHTGESSIDNENNITESLLIGQWNHTIKSTDITTSIADVRWADNSSNSKHDWSSSISISHALNNGNMFGEIARGYNGTGGSIAGLRLKFPKTMYLLSARYYSKGYSAMRANPLAEWVGSDRNEMGIYQGINFKYKAQQIILFGDLFKTDDVEDNDVFPTIGQEAGIRWEWRAGRRYQRIQLSTERKSVEENGAYITEDQITDETKRTIKYSGVYKLASAMWGKFQFTYNTEMISENYSKALGVDVNFWLELDQLSVYFDLVTVFTNNGSAWIYFWDVNLPGEMTTRVYTRDTFSPAMKILYNTHTGFEFGIRARAQWKNFDFKGTPDIYGALVLDILL